MLKSLAQRIVRGVLLLMVLASPLMLHAQQQEIPIWPGTAPGSENWTYKEVDYLSKSGAKMVRNVAKPTLTVYRANPARANGTAVIVCPGGGFRTLSFQNGGYDVGQWLSERGVTAFLLKYRLADTGATDEEFQKAMAELNRVTTHITETAGPNSPPPPDPVRERILPFSAADGHQAIKLIRERAAEWGIAPDRIGIIGFSAGGLVASEAALHYTAPDRPNFAAPIYGAPWVDVQVPADAPPIFIAVANDDPIASWTSVHLFSEWKAAGKPAELHIFSIGGHGFTTVKHEVPARHWIDRFGDWLDEQGLLQPAQH
jgi:acetyl esterase/lipase